MDIVIIFLAPTAKGRNPQGTSFWPKWGSDQSAILTRIVGKTKSRKRLISTYSVWSCSWHTTQPVSNKLAQLCLFQCTAVWDSVHLYLLWGFHPPLAAKQQQAISAVDNGVCVCEREKCALWPDGHFNGTDMWLAGWHAAGKAMVVRR